MTHPASSDNLEATDASFAWISPEAIHVRPGFNPRRNFDPNHLSDLAGRIAREGLIHPLLVRPRDEGDGYELVCGERRLRASRQAGLEQVPAYVRALSVSQAQALALSENENRQDLSPAEEARYARMWLEQCDGDRDEATKQLGWTRAKLDARLLLTQATDEVLDALEQRQIKVGHAELLAGQPIETQQATLPRVIDKQPSVAELKSSIKAQSTPLKHAIFDLTECQTCPHNSAYQATLFDEAVEGSVCQNRVCFTAKTREALDERKAELAEKYNVVRFESEVSPDSTRVVTVDGPNGVGQRQLEQFRGCASHGVLIRDRIDERVGEVTEDVCFDTSVFEQMRASYQDRTRERAQAGSGGARPGARQAASTTASAGSARDASTARASGTSTAVAGGADEVPKAVYNHVNERLIEAADEAVVADADEAMRYAVLALVRYIMQGHGPADTQRTSPAARADQAVRGAIEQYGGTSPLVGSALPSSSEPRLLDALHALDSQALARLHSELAGIAATVGRNEIKPSADEAAARARAVLKHTGHAFSAYCPISESMLACMTRKAAESVLTDVGFYAWVDAQDDARERRKRLRQAKAKEFPGVVMAEGFDFTGKVPSLLQRFTWVSDDSQGASVGGGHDDNGEHEEAA